MSTAQYNHCQPDQVLQKVGGDLDVLGKLTDAYLKELPAHLAALHPDTARVDIVKAGQTLHQLRTTFAMFAADKACGLEFWLREQLQASKLPQDDAWHALRSEMIGLGCDLKRFGARSRVSQPGATRL